jgi:hypothetical protein
MPVPEPPGGAGASAGGHNWDMAFLGWATMTESPVRSMTNQEAG